MEVGMGGGSSRTLARVVGALLGSGADLAVGDPRRGHPVAGFGRAASALERRMYGDSRLAGIGFTAALVGSVVAGSGLLVAGARRAPRTVGWWLEMVLTAGATWAALGGRSLAGEGDVMAALLESGDIAAARRRLSHLCARDATGLDADELARAALESIAENTSDAVVAPLLWVAVTGAPGALGYRAANTLDAMVGYRSERYERFGWASARLDDLLNIVPARLGAALTVGCAPLVTGSAATSWQVWRRDAAGHPSPNAGQVEAAFAGALGVTLGGTNSYAGVPEVRGSLGDGPAPSTADLRRGVRLSRAVGLAAALTAATVAGAVAVAAGPRLVL